MCLQDIIDRSHDELHDRCGGIEYSSLHAEGTIILTEEVLIEVDDGIMCLFLIDSVHEILHVCMSEYFTELIDDIFETFLISFSGDMVEKSPKERIRLRNEITSLRAREVIRGLVMIASHEESIDERLSIEISEVVMREIMEDF